MTRTDWPTYFLDLALRCAQQGTCIRRNSGAVIVDGTRIVSTGYTGTPVGMPHCAGLGCYREEHRIPAGKNYEACRSVHAEMNALLQARESVAGMTMYLASQDVATGAGIVRGPCMLCTKLLLNAGIARVVIRGDTALFRTPGELYQEHLVAMEADWAATGSPPAEADPLTGLAVGLGAVAGACAIKYLSRGIVPSRYRRFAHYRREGR